MADTLDLGSSAARCKGSSPFSRISFLLGGKSSSRRYGFCRYSLKIREREVN